MSSSNPAGREIRVNKHYTYFSSCLKPEYIKTFIKKLLHKFQMPQKLQNASAKFRFLAYSAMGFRGATFFPHERETSLGQKYTGVQFSNELGPSYQKSTYSLAACVQTCA